MIRALTVSVAAVALAAARVVAQTPCAKAPGEARTAFFIEAATPAPSDTLIIARLCVQSVTAVGSFMATVGYDSTRLRLINAEPANGMQAINARVPGVVRIAGAAPSGLANGAVTTMSFKPLQGRAIGLVSLEVPEVSATNGLSLTAVVRATGLSSSPRASATRPVIDSIRPRAGELSAERVLDVVLYGRNFTERGNTVMFGGAEVIGLASERGGTMIRFAAPVDVPARNGASARRVKAGRIEVRVTNAGGTSTAVGFTVKGDG